MEAADKRRPLRPLYFYALAGVVAALVLVSGVLHVARTRRELLKIYEASARTMAEGVQRLVDHSLTLLEIAGQVPAGGEESLPLDDVLLEYLAGLAAEIDQDLVAKTPEQLDIQEPGVSFHLLPAEVQAALANPSYGRLVRSLESKKETVAIQRLRPGPSGGGWLQMAFRRHFGPGFIILEVEDSHRLLLLKKLLFKDVVAAFSVRPDLLDLILVDLQGRLLARLAKNPRPLVPLPQPASLEQGDRPWLLKLTSHGDQPALDLDSGVSFRGRKVAILRLSISLTGMEKILAESRKATYGLSAVLLLVGFALVRFIFWRQQTTVERLRQMEEQIRRRQELVALGEMAAGVAHEIRNPLNAISMGLQSLALGKGRGEGGSGQAAGELLETLQREVGRINRIVSEFLAFSRPEEVGSERLSLGEVAEHVADLLRQAAAERQVEVRLEGEASGCPVRGDRDKLTQALLNLGINALEACSAGGQVGLRLACQGEVAQLEVVDTGRGIKEEDQTQLFRPHFTTKEKGLGLGLFLAQRIIQAHGGTVSLGKSCPQGTTMVITLPRVRD